MGYSDFVIESSVFLPVLLGTRMNVFRKRRMSYYLSSVARSREAKRIISSKSHMIQI